MDRIWVIVIGGLIPAVGFALAAIFQKAALISGAGVGAYVFYVGVVLAIAGVILRLVFGETEWVIGGAIYAILAGLGMVIGIGLVSYAVQRLGAPISLLVPIHAIAPLIIVVIGFAVFKEYEDVATLKLIGGALLVAVGAALVATS